jgi:hypothetical protein
MSKLIGDKLTDDLYQRLIGHDLARDAEKVILLSTIDEGGWPRCFQKDYPLATASGSVPGRLTDTRLEL